ncbi:glycosyltransferase family 9 protein [Chondrinema litorale]|uniref:glycosyltransferase family 9 protein n=1 Tax=Chondrinema litorale TaxID=2994555 RepID=UPI002543A1C2|nr:glycosyltransferase family 9 protein [Chondrinema litorale]UZR95793.1 glycosyltransferase family 9 protein [Chondrinema litorale]
MKKILIIQTAYIGDVILATPLIENLKNHFNDVSIDFLLRKGNESLLKNHPVINEVLIWDKKKDKNRGLWKLSKIIRKRKYDTVINLQRFLSSGLMVAFSGAKKVIGFDKNPMSFMFSDKLPHLIGEKIQTSFVHETQRNLSLLAPLGINNIEDHRPRLYPSLSDREKVAVYKEDDYICLAPTSVWYTKQFHKEGWVDFIKNLDFEGKIYLLGASSDFDACELIINEAAKSNVVNLTGKLNLLQSAALMEGALVNFVNDSAPMHLASSVNAPVCAIYCSTVPDFGFGPLSEFSKVVEVKEKLDCRPCGLHGYKTCPQKHFSCAKGIQTTQLLEVFEKAKAYHN